MLLLDVGEGASMVVESGLEGGGGRPHILLGDVVLLCVGSGLVDHPFDHALLLKWTDNIFITVTDYFLLLLLLLQDLHVVSRQVFIHARHAAIRKLAVVLIE